MPGFRVWHYYITTHNGIHALLLQRSTNAFDLEFNPDGDAANVHV